MDKVVVDMHKTFATYAPYVVLSRVTKKSDLHIKNLTKVKIRQNSSVKNELQELCTGATLQLSYAPIYAMD